VRRRHFANSFLANVETKLTKLDKIEERLDIMDKKFKTVGT